MKNLFILLFLVLFYKSNACCYELVYRLFPLAELNKEILFVEFELVRSCVKKDDPLLYEYWINGNMNIVKQGKDSLEIVYEFEPIQFMECLCTFDNHFQSSNFIEKLSDKYLTAVNYVKSINGVKSVMPLKIDFTDSQFSILEDYENGKIVFNNNENNKIYIEIDFDNVPLCFSNKIDVIRSYYTANFNITIIRINCYSHKRDIEKEKLEFFKSKLPISQAPAISHNRSVEYLFIENK